MKNKKIIAVCICIGMIICIVYFLVCKKETLKQISNNVMTDEFSRTLDSYYCDNDNEFELQIYSADTQWSSLKTITLYNYLGIKSTLIKSLKESENEFRFEVEKSIYFEKNYIDLNRLNDQAKIIDFYYAICVANYNEDDDLLKKIGEKYENYKYNNDNSIMNKIVLHYLKNEKLKKNYWISSEICRIANEDNFYTDDESLNSLMSYIQYMLILDDNSLNNEVRKIYHRFIDYSNQMYILFDMDAVFEDYLWTLRLLEEYLNYSTNTDLFHEMKCDNLFVNKGIEYQITPYNFACYITALSYQNKPISDNVYNNLKIIFYELASNINAQNYFDIYYLRYSAEFLNLEYKIQNNNIDHEDYYYLITHGSSVDVETLNIEDDGLISLLMSADVCYESDQVKKKLNKIDILSYSNINEYGMILNLYVLAMKKYGMLDEKLVAEIKEYINNNRGKFGYEVDGAYDFRTSVYYTNILYILDGGKDIGLR